MGKRLAPHLVTQKVARSVAVLEGGGSGQTWRPSPHSQSLEEGAAHSALAARGRRPDCTSPGIREVLGSKHFPKAAGIQQDLDSQGRLGPAVST